MSEFEMKIKQHWSRHDDWYYIEGRLTMGKDLMITSGLERDHSATVRLNVSQIDKLIKHLRDARAEIYRLTERKYCPCDGCHHPIDLYGCNGMMMTEAEHKEHILIMQKFGIDVPMTD